MLELKQRGVGAAAMQALVDRLSIELVFTAHPTEAKRRTLLTKLQRLGEILRERAEPALAGDTAVLDPDCVEREIASLWLTDRSRVARPEVTDEARTGLWYFDTTLYATLPRLQVDMERRWPGITRKFARPGPGCRSARGLAVTATAIPTSRRPSPRRCCSCIAVWPSRNSGSRRANWRAP